VIASGGNAGLAAAWAARRLQVRCTVFIVEGVSASTIALLRQYGAEVNVGGAFYLETLGHAREAVARDPDACVQSPVAQQRLGLTSGRTAA
jgi:L-serine/L-threonine ammonia-lyase